MWSRGKTWSTLCLGRNIPREIAETASREKFERRKNEKSAIKGWLESEAARAGSSAADDCIEGLSGSSSHLTGGLQRGSLSDRCTPCVYPFGVRKANQ